MLRFDQRSKLEELPASESEVGMVSFNPQVSSVVVNNHISVKAAAEISGYRPPAPAAFVVTPTQFQSVRLT